MLSQSVDVIQAIAMPIIARQSTFENLIEEIRYSSIPQYTKGTQEYNDFKVFQRNCFSWNAQFSKSKVSYDSFKQSTGYFGDIDHLDKTEIADTINKYWQLPFVSTI
ncbi:MAG TPA: hypothetical protein VK658_01085 [Chryseolinea sp.]|nr:hypothetical protein [Chryseolinea sp.]